ncbi:MAG TPA: cytochrome b/b6 domain-containing protein [Burkholderiales bacterium]|nr:cytochrome b/b6 domain-containing protein [Burkholderiales bacterium]
MEKTKVLIWDLPTRVFHWLLAASFLGAFVTAESERFRDVHVALGYTMLGLIGFRLLWGVIGTRYARFGSFAFGPRSVVRYVKSLFTRSPQHHPGHNPAGSWAIYALLALAVVTGLTGYAAYNDLGGDWGEELHEAIANAMLAVVFVHIAGVVVSSLIHRENLARAMISGYKAGNPGDGIRYRHRLIAALLVIATIGFWAGGADYLAAISGGGAQAATAQKHAGHDDRD